MSTIILLFRDTAIGRHNERLRIGRIVIKTTLLIRPFNDTRGLEKLGPYEAGAKKLVDEIVRSLDKRFASGNLTDDDVVSLFAEKCRFTSYLAPLIRNLRLLDPNIAGISAMYLWQLIGAAFRSGQLNPDGKIATEMEEEAHQKKSLRGGVKSGISRNVKAEITWRPHALDLALESRQQTPHASQDDVATDVSAGWKLSGPGAPRHSTLKSFISAAEKDGRLPKRKPRPRRNRPMKRFI